MKSLVDESACLVNQILIFGVFFINYFPLALVHKAVMGVMFWEKIDLTLTKASSEIKLG